MKTSVYLLAAFLLCSACRQPVDTDKIKKEIFDTEKAFEKMAAEKGIAAAFHHFADEHAVIKRENDTLIIGKDNIRAYYEKRVSNATVNWTPDFIDVAECGTLGYTYGKFVWRIPNDEGTATEIKGVFHTVWKRQQDNTWKYVWD